MTQKGLGNVEPTDAERARMLAVLDGLRQRIKGGASFAPAVFNEKTHTAELRWEGGSREWIVAWIDGLSGGRLLCVWRHPTYRFERDNNWISERCR